MEIGNGPRSEPRTVTLARRPGENRASAHAPSSRVNPAPVDPRARGSRGARTGLKTAVRWPGANARVDRNLGDGASSVIGYPVPSDLL